jgi:hypothetical protein
MDLTGITEEDKNIVLESVLNQLLIEMVERDTIAIRQSKVKLKEPYLDLLEQVLSNAIQKRKELNDKKRTLGIKVMDKKDINEDFVEYPYLVRGYNSQMNLFRSAIRNYVRDRLKTHFGLSVHKKE